MLGLNPLHTASISMHHQHSVSYNPLLPKWLILLSPSLAVFAHRHSLVFRVSVTGCCWCWWCCLCGCWYSFNFGSGGCSSFPVVAVHVAEIPAGLDDVPYAPLQLLGLGEATFCLPVPQEARGARARARRRICCLNSDGKHTAGGRLKSDFPQGQAKCRQEFLCKLSLYVSEGKGEAYMACQWVVYKWARNTYVCCPEHPFALGHCNGEQVDLFEVFPWAYSRSLSPVCKTESQRGEAGPVYSSGQLPAAVQAQKYPSSRWPSLLGFDGVSLVVFVREWGYGVQNKGTMMSRNSQCLSAAGVCGIIFCSFPTKTCYGIGPALFFGLPLSKEARRQRWQNKCAYILFLISRCLILGFFGPCILESVYKYIQLIYIVLSWMQMKQI